MSNTKDEVEKLKAKVDRFENYLERFTTGDRTVKMKHVDDSFRDMKKSMTNLRQVALKSNDLKR